MQKQHFDGWGHKTLGYLELVKRFSRDFLSVAVLRQQSPYKYVVLPDIEINVKKGAMDEFYVSLYWPGETRRFCKKCNQRSLDALRRLARSSKAGWNVLVLKEGVRYFRRGRIIINKAAVSYSLPIADE